MKKLFWERIIGVLVVGVSFFLGTVQARTPDYVDQWWTYYYANSSDDTAYDMADTYTAHDYTYHYGYEGTTSMKKRKKYENILKEYDARQKYHEQGTTYDDWYDPVAAGWRKRTYENKYYLASANEYWDEYDDNYDYAYDDIYDDSHGQQYYSPTSYNRDAYTQAYRDLGKERSQLMQKYILLFWQSTRDPEDLLGSFKSDVLSYLNRRWSTLRKYVLQDNLDEYDAALKKKKAMINAVFSTNMYGDANYSYGQHASTSSQLLQRLDIVRRDVKRMLARSDATQDERALWQAVQVMLDIQYMLLTGPYSYTYAQNYWTTVGYLNMSDPTAVNRLVKRLHQIIYY